MDIKMSNFPCRKTQDVTACERRERHFEKGFSVGEIIPVEQYNNRQLANWRDYTKGGGSVNTLPMWVYEDAKGNYKKEGFVLIMENGSRLFKTKRDAEESKKQIL